jgi:predicted nucleic acid-binding protein
VKPIVVDACVVIAGLLKDRAVRDALLSSGTYAFSAPAYLRGELTQHLGRIASKSRLPESTVEAVIADILGAIDMAPPGVYTPWLDLARKLARDADALGDEEYIALALALEAPIWTLERHFSRIQGLRTLSTSDLESD